MAVQPKVTTVEEFWEQYAGKPYELIHGEVFEIVPTGYVHGSIASRVTRWLRDFVDQNHLGDVVGGETGFVLAIDTMRAADVAFINNEKLKSIAQPEKFLPFPPDLAVEIVSPHDTPAMVQRKIRLYMEAGTQLVWIFYADLREVAVYESGGRTKTIDIHGLLDGGNVLPGLSIPVAKLFPPEQKSSGK